jgi:hypothetical protein
MALEISDIGRRSLLLGEVFSLHGIHKKLYTILRIFEEEIETS